MKCMFKLVQIRWLTLPINDILIFWAHEVLNGLCCVFGIIVFLHYKSFSNQSGCVWFDLFFQNPDINLYVHPCLLFVANIINEHHGACSTSSFCKPEPWHHLTVFHWWSTVLLELSQVRVFFKLLISHHLDTY